MARRVTRRAERRGVTSRVTGRERRGEGRRAEKGGERRGKGEGGQEAPAGAGEEGPDGAEPAGCGGGGGDQTYPYMSWSAAVKAGYCSPSSTPMNITMLPKTGSVQGILSCALEDGVKAFRFPAGIFEIDEQSDEPIWGPWLEGFQTGMELREQSWVGLADTKDRNVTVAIGTVGLLVLAMDAALESGEVKADVIATDAADSLQEAVEILYAHRTGQKTWKLASPLRPFQHDKIGRNDPCSCGSGRKYKKCCGAS
mgnify:CR=1 FL=1